MRITTKPRLTVVDNDNSDHPTPTPHPPVIFAAYLRGSVSHPDGEMTARLGVPFDQKPNFFPLEQYPGGVMFKVTMQRVAPEELPAGGWGNGDG